MPTRPSRSTGSPARALGRALLATAAFALLVGCTSTPCVGDACPDACNGLDCDEARAATDPTTTGRFTACATNAGCDEASGFECVDGLCRHACRSHFDCGGVGVCESSKSGTFCALTDPPTKPGGYYSRCPNGSECDDTRGFRCVGELGNTEAFCTLDCSEDADCPTGYLCDTVADENGTERTACAPRGFCSECESDTDCLAVPGGVCARDASGEKRCTQRCSPSRNSCPWGTATECRVTDDELGVATCQHRFGACHGAGNGCDPCLRDADCPTGYCLVSFYTGERWCIDQSSPCTCADLPRVQDFCSGATTTCPGSPDGRQMICFDPNPAGGGVCVGVNLPGAASTQLSCWR